MSNTDRDKESDPSPQHTPQHLYGQYSQLLNPDYGQPISSHPTQQTPLDGLMASMSLTDYSYAEQYPSYDLLPPTYHHLQPPIVPDVPAVVYSYGPPPSSNPYLSQHLPTPSPYAHSIYPQLPPPPPPPGEVHAAQTQSNHRNIQTVLLPRVVGLRAPHTGTVSNTERNPRRVVTLSGSPAPGSAAVHPNHSPSPVRGATAAAVSLPATSSVGVAAAGVVSSATSNMVHSISQQIDQTAFGIKDVWAGNMEEELKVIRRLVLRYPYIAMDTEFPGVVARPIGEFKTQSDYQYQLLRCNVDILKIIQIGFTFMDENGNFPPDITTWQFNFKFSLHEDMYAQDSIDLLTNSGIQFARHDEEGIDMFEFAEVLTTSGMVLNEDVKFISFHSGYDFGYLLKVLSGAELPDTESEFFELIKVYFPNIYDVKYLMKSCKNLHGGLQEVADQLELKRLGPQHQAGSDARLTGLAFFKLRELYFENSIDDSKYCGHLFGLGTTYSTHYVSNGSGSSGTYRGGTPQPAQTSNSNNDVSSNNVSQSDNSTS